MPHIFIDPLSATALRIELFFGVTPLGKATGFTVRHEDNFYLVTNWHVVTGRNADTGDCLDKKYASVPDRMYVSFHAHHKIGAWQRTEVALLSPEGDPLWIEHPEGRRVDVVAILLGPLPLTQIRPLDLKLATTDLLVAPAMPVSVIGYPLGLVAGENWPIWKTGHVASDPDIDYEPGRPAFLIDATTREGMSGAPVIVRMTSGYVTEAGTQILGSGPVTKFVGIYAGRIHEESEIGRVWRPFVLQEIFAQRLLFNEDTRRQRPSRVTPCPCTSGKRFRDCCGELGDKPLATPLLFSCLIPSVASAAAHIKPLPIISCSPVQYPVCWRPQKHVQPLPPRQHHLRA